MTGDVRDQSRRRGVDEDAAAATVRPAVMRERLVAAEHIPVPAHESTTGPGRPLMSSLSSVILLAHAHAHAHEFPQVSSSQALPTLVLHTTTCSRFRVHTCKLPLRAGRHLSAKSPSPLQVSDEYSPGARASSFSQNRA